jgi:polyhydroxybutyrate depolymerase
VKKQPHRLTAALFALGAMIAQPGQILAQSPGQVQGQVQGQTQYQTQYQFVPGSRQARAVQVPVGGQVNAGANSPAYAQPVKRSGGMQLHTPYASNQTYAHQPLTNNPAHTGSKNKSFDFIDQLSVDGQARSYRVHIPACYDRTRATPVVFAFHGLGMNSVAMLGMSGFNGLSERKGFIVVYGEGLNNRWNDGTAAGADDLAYVQAVMQKLPRIANIDTRRVYACGISNGGFFTQRLASAMPDKFAAAGVVASSMITSAMTSSGAKVPIVFFLGTEDPLLPWGDGRTKALGNLGESLGLSGLGSIDNPMARMGGLVPVPEMIAFWTGRNGCSSGPSITAMPDASPKDGTKVKRELYGNGDVTLYVIEGGGHTWPGSFEVKSVADLCGVTSQDLDATETMWEFFARHSR